MKKLSTIKNKYCRMCTSSTFTNVINIGNHPLVNSLVSKKDIKKKDPTFPIKVVQCKACKLVQLKEIVDPNEIYKNVDYLYFSSDMPGLDNYFKPYAEDLKKRFLKKNDFVVEIGCNDGIMLKFFKNKYRVLGIDPSTNVILRTLKNGINSVPLFFDSNLARQVKSEWGAAKLIYGNNCIAHLNNLKDLTAGVSNLLTDDGIFVVECNYWGGMVDNVNYSLIYHDHYSYFSAKVWEKFAKKYRLKLFDALVTPAQGGSLRIFMSKNNRPKTKRLIDLLNTEKKTGLNTKKCSIEYKKNVKNITDKLGKLVKSLRKSGKVIAGYGAAAKGMTILKCSDLGKELDYFVDDSPAKQGLFSPVDHIKIISRKQAEKILPDYFIILAPNYSDVIISKEKKFIKNGGKFIIPKDGVKIFPS